MARRDQVTVDGLPACEVDTAEELTQVLVPGVYVRAPAGLAAGGEVALRGGRPAAVPLAGFGPDGPFVTTSLAPEVGPGCGSAGVS